MILLRLFYFITGRGYLNDHRRRISFYDSETMREATKSSGADKFCWFTDEALQTIVETEPNTLRCEAAHHELETRAIRRRQEKNVVARFLFH